MMGRSHLVSAVALLGVTDGIAHGMDAVVQQLGGQLNMAERFHGMLIRGDGLPMVAWAVGSLALYFFGALLPDIDTEQSLIRRLFRRKGHKPAANDGVNRFHRTWTHSIWPMIPILVGAYFVPILFWLWLGYFGHLFMDSVSSMGICWLYPIQQYWEAPSGARVAKGHKLKLYKTGTGMETVVLILICIIGLVLFGLTHTSGKFLNLFSLSV